jgi:hypothetical protein
LPVLSSAVSSGFKAKVSHGEKGPAERGAGEKEPSNLKAVESDDDECQICNDLPRLEQMDGGSAVVPPSFAKAPGVEMVDGHYVSCKELARQRKVESEKKQSIAAHDNSSSLNS